MAIGRGFAEQRVDLPLRDGATGRELDGREIRLLVDPDVEDGRDVLERIPNERRAALTAGLLDLEDSGLHGPQTTVVRLGAVQVEILYCPT